MWNQTRLQRDGHHYVLTVPGPGKIWQGLALACALLIVGLLFFAGDKSFFQWMTLNREKAQLQDRIAAATLDCQRLSRQIKDLQNDPKAIERIAREELGVVRPDEIVYRFIPPAADPKDNR